MRPEDYTEGFTPIYDDELLDAAREYYGKYELTDEEIEKFEEYQKDLAQGDL